MALTQREIEIVISAKNLLSGVITDAESGLDDLGKKSEEMGEKTERASGIARLGIWGLGEQVQNLGNQFGIPFQMSRKVGNAFEELAAKGGMLAAGLGIVGLAVTAGVMAWNHFVEAKKKAGAELDRSISALKGEMTALYGNKLETIATREASTGLLKAKRDLLILQLQKEIREETKAYNEQKDTLNEASFGLRNRITALKEFGGSSEKIKALEEEYNETLLKQNIQQKEIIADQALLNALRQNAPPDTFTPMTEQSAALAAHRYELRMMTEDYGLLAMMGSASLSQLAGQEEVLARASQFRSNVSSAANRAMETQILRLVETHKFSISEFGKAVMQAVKIELVGIAARAAVWALFETAMGLATMFTNPAASSAHFASAATFAAVAGATVAAAMAVNTLSGPGATMPGPGEPGGTPIQTTPGAISPGQAAGPTYQISLTIVNPLSDQNWDEAIENHLMPALERAGARNVQLSTNVIPA